MAVLTRRRTVRGSTARWAALPLALVLLAGTGTPVGAQILTQDEALAKAFPDAGAVERRTAYLDDGQLARIRQLAGSSRSGATRPLSLSVSSETAGISSRSSNARAALGASSVTWLMAAS